MIRTKHEVIRRTNDSVEVDAEFEEDITYKFNTFRDIRVFFLEYKFNDFHNEYNCQVRCSGMYYLKIFYGTNGLYFGKFLGFSIDITNRNEVDFFALPTFSESKDTIRFLNNLLQNKLYTKAEVCASMDIIYFLSHRFDDPTVETPFTTDKCCICLTEKPDIILVPCLHKSVCLQCEEKGKLEKCPTCRVTITRKIKI